MPGTLGTDSPHRATSQGVNLRPPESTKMLSSQKGKVGDSIEGVNERDGCSLWPGEAGRTIG